MTFARLCGILLQALILGVLLFFALGELIELDGGARIFRYQAF